MEFLRYSSVDADEFLAPESIKIPLPRMSPVPVVVISELALEEPVQGCVSVVGNSDAENENEMEDDRFSTTSSSGSPGSELSDSPSNSAMSDGSGTNKEMEMMAMSCSHLSVASGDGCWEEASTFASISSLSESTLSCSTPTSECSSESLWKIPEAPAVQTGDISDAALPAAEYGSSGSASSEKERRIRKKGSVRRLESRMQTLEQGTKTLLPHGCVKFALKRNVLITAPAELLGPDFTSPVGAGMDTAFEVTVEGAMQNHRVLRASNREASFTAEMEEPENLYDQLWVALQFGDDAKLVKSLLPTRVVTFTKSEPVDFGSWPDKYAILGEAASQGRLEALRYLVESLGCDVSSPYGKGLRSPLQIAAYNGHLEVCRLLLRSGARLDHRDLNDESPLAAAIHGGHFHIARLIRQYLDGKGDSAGLKPESGRSSLRSEGPASPRPAPAWRSRVFQMAEERAKAEGARPLMRTRSLNQQHVPRVPQQQQQQQQPQPPIGFGAGDGFPSEYGSGSSMRNSSWRSAGPIGSYQSTGPSQFPRGTGRVSPLSQSRPTAGSFSGPVYDQSSEYRSCASQYPQQPQSVGRMGLPTGKDCSSSGRFEATRALGCTGIGSNAGTWRRK